METKLVVEVSKQVHYKRTVLLLKFYYNQELIDLAKMAGCSWSAQLKGWYSPFDQKNWAAIRAVFMDKADLRYSFDLADDMPEKAVVLRTAKEKKDIKAQAVSGENRRFLHGFVKFLRGKRYSESTVRTYYIHVLDFLIYLKDKPKFDICNRDVAMFVEDVCMPQNFSISTHRQLVSAMKQFKEFYPDCKLEKLEFMRPKKSSYLPVVLSYEEVIALLRCTKNLKHRAILAMIYSCGLRISELIHLELRDMDVNRMQVLIRNSKNRKDRYVMMAESFLPLLQNYIQTYNPGTYFVEGIKPGTPYTAESIRAFLKVSCRAAGIIKQVTPHTLRHSYATHLLEFGTNLRYIQELLGHSRPETTMVYTHVMHKDLKKVGSPLDNVVRHMQDSDKNKQNFLLSQNNDV